MRMPKFLLTLKMLNKFSRFENSEPEFSTDFIINGK